MTKPPIAKSRVYPFKSYIPYNGTIVFNTQNTTLSGMKLKTRATGTKRILNTSNGKFNSSRNGVQNNKVNGNTFQNKETIGY